MKVCGSNSRTLNNSPPEPARVAQAYTEKKPAGSKPRAANSMSPRRSLRPVLLVIGLLCALVFLAVLQYRWSGQVSEAERIRMQGSLQLASDQFRREFARDLLAVSSALQAEPEIAEAADWQSLAQTQAEWLAAQSSHLVSAVYLLPPDGHLLQLDPSQSKYAAVTVPREMTALVDRLSAFDERRPGMPRNSAWVMEGEAPMLIHLLGLQERDRQRGGPGNFAASPERRLGFQIVVLNHETLTRKFLPELAARHFGTGDGSLLYQAQVYLAGQAGAPLYNSSGSPILKAADADLDVELIDLRPRGGGPDRGLRDRPRFNFRDWRNARPRDGRGGPPEGFRGFTAPFLMTDGGPTWKLAVRHRAGSVAAAVETLRWRNLAVSFAILLVLGAGMVTIVRNTQRAQRLAELQMEFVAGVSHELRTPLAVISSAAENLTDGIVEEQAQVKQYGSLIRNESRRLAGMMEQILQFAAGQKRRPYKPITLHVEDLVEGALALSQTALTEGGFTVEQHIAPNLPTVRGERGALTQCLQNLVSNAAKYSGDSRWIGIRADSQAGSVTVTVEDHGIGVEKADLPHLFDAFYRARAVRSAQIHGTGLGLNLARSFARDAAGDITVESVAGKGSRFTLRLPADSATLSKPARLVNQTA